MLGKKTVLIVDDDSMIRDVIKTCLESEQLELYEAGTCCRALKLMSIIRFDAILLDNTLPDGQGIDLLAQVTTHCPRVIMITADEPVIRHHALSLGAEMIFPKPFDLEVVKAHIAIGWKL